MKDKISFEELDKMREQEALKEELTKKVLAVITEVSGTGNLISTRGICNEIGIDNTDVVLWRCQLLEEKEKRIEGVLSGNMYYWKLVTVDGK